MNFSSVNFKQLIYLHICLIFQLIIKVLESIKPWHFYIEKEPNLKFLYYIFIFKNTMIGQSFPLITFEDTAKNQNAEFGIDLPVQLSMANGNTQFAIDMAKNMKISYSIPTIALQIASRFFHLRCYIHYDRFMIILACMVLAFKLVYMEFRFKDIAFAYLQIVNFRCQKNELIDELIVNKVKDQICVAQNEVLRTLQYDIDIVTPHDYLAKILQVAPLSSLPKNKEERIRLTTRILILDSNRTQSSLYFSPFSIGVACLLIACRYEGIKPYEIYCDAKGNQPTGVNVNDEQLYMDWLNLISKDQKQKLKQEDILECLKHMNKLFNLIVQTNH